MLIQSSISFHTIVADGHCVKAIQAAFAEAKATKGKPTALILKTFKGSGIEGIEDKENWHGKPIGDKAESAIKGMKPSKCFLTQKKFIICVTYHDFIAFK